MSSVLSTTVLNNEEYIMANIDETTIIAMINAWKEAAIKLNIAIETPFSLKNGTQIIEYCLLIKHFGSKLGTLISLNNDEVNLNIAKKHGYFYSQLNPNSYAKFDQSLFLDTLNDWGYYGENSNKPGWYTGEPWTK
jgi:hypothetical protein